VYNLSYCGSRGAGCADPVRKRVVADSGNVACVGGQPYDTYAQKRFPLC
jgi:hypothetical protein